MQHPILSGISLVAVVSLVVWCLTRKPKSKTVVLDGDRPWPNPNPDWRDRSEDDAGYKK